MKNKREDEVEEEAPVAVAEEEDPLGHLSKKARKREIRKGRLLADKEARLAVHRRGVEERAAEREVKRLEYLATKTPQELAAEEAYQVTRRLERRREKEKIEAAFVVKCAASFTIAIDCGFEHMMSDRERTSMCQQLLFCYAANRRAPSPSTMLLLGMQPDSSSHSQVSKVVVEERWLGFLSDPRPLKEYVTESNPKRTVTNKKVVYLTSDSDTVIEELDNDTVYVIGGIVDRNRHKGLTSEKAKELGIPTARLPVGVGPDSIVQLGAMSPVLTVNHVFEFLLKRQETGSWLEAAEVLPGRKNAKGAGTPASTPLTSKMTKAAPSPSDETPDVTASSSMTKAAPPSDETPAVPAPSSTPLPEAGGDDNPEPSS